MATRRAVITITGPHAHTTARHPRRGNPGEIIGLLEELWADRGQTVVIVTHDGWIADRAPKRAWIGEGGLSMHTELRGDLQPIPRGAGFTG